MKDLSIKQNLLGTAADNSKNKLHLLKSISAENIKQMYGIPKLNL